MEQPTSYIVAVPCGWPFRAIKGPSVLAGNQALLLPLPDRLSFSLLCRKPPSFRQAEVTCR